MQHDIHELESPALRDVVDSLGGGVVTAAVTVAEVMDEDGAFLVILRDSDSTTWKRIGMLTSALRDDEAASYGGVIADQVNGD